VSCFVCGEPASLNEHHIIPQAKGGTEGPTVDLCANCHSRIHSSARAMLRGKSPDKFLDGLDEDAKDRALGLAQVIVAADTRENSNRLLSVILDDPCYMKALKLFQRDSGFSSQAAAVNGLLREIAGRYGLLENNEPVARKRSKISDLR
jgi:hypothetical protein